MPSQTYYPVNPPIMMQDKNERDCYDEPNPTEEWLVKKAAAEAKRNALKTDDWLCYLN